MNMAPTLSFVIGAVAASASLLILIPIRATHWRPGLAPKLAAVLTLMVPLIIVAMLRAPGPSPSLASLTEPLPPAAPEAGLRDSEWATLAHAYLGGPPPAVDGPAPVVERAAQDVAQMESA